MYKLTTMKRMYKKIIKIIIQNQEITIKLGSIMR